MVTHSVMTIVVVPMKSLTPIHIGPRLVFHCVLQVVSLHLLAPIHPKRRVIRHRRVDCDRPASMQFRLQVFVYCIRNVHFPCLRFIASMLKHKRIVAAECEKLTGDRSYVEKLQMCRKKWMSGPELRDAMVLKVMFHDNSSESGTWMYLDSGANRLVFSYMHAPLIMKRHPRSEVSQNREEHKIYHGGSGLEQILPRGHGLTITRIGNTEFELLFVERVAFTAEHLFQKLQSQPPSMYNVQLVSYSILLIIEAASTMAGNMHQVQIWDWHAKNIAFTDSNPPEVK